ncbi:MAG: hypothetical protein ACI4JF_07790, partial [Oscillospiraceae bacterium]
KSQNALKPLSEEAPQSAQSVENVGQALSSAANSAASTKKELGELSVELNNAKEEADKLGQKTEGLGEKSDDAENKLDDLGNAAEKSENKFKSLGTVLKSLGLAAAASAIGAAAAKLGKAIVSSYADYEQLIGGVETLFKESSATIQEYADNAYKTAGMSANEYMETVTGFSASLISSLGGDTAKAAEYANMAITDMSDNANKMGTDIESIKNAYQGFAKQNYTMLDNLKLGYGGTKEEVERLLEDAEKLSGIKYDISSYADVVSAIHVIQESMDIAGTTAAEAEHTISGSIDTLKGAISNLATGFGNAEADIEQLCQNVAEAFTNVVNNITPVIENIIAALPTAVNALLDAVGEMLPTMLQAAAELFSQMLSAILELLPELIPAAVDAVILIADTIIENAPLLTNSAVQLITELASGLGENADELIPAAMDAVLSIAQGLIDNADLLLDSAEQLVIGIRRGLINSVPRIAEAAPSIIIGLAEALLESAITLLVDLPLQILDNIANGMTGYNWDDTADSVMDNVCTAYEKAVDSVTERLTDIGESINRLLFPSKYEDIDTSEYEGYTREQLKSLINSTQDSLDYYKNALSELENVGYDFELLPEDMLKKLSDEFGEENLFALKELLEQEIQSLTDSKVEMLEAFRKLQSGELISQAAGDNVSVMAQYYEQQGKQAQKAAEMAENAADTISELEDKVSDEFKSAYDNLNMQQIYGEISEEEYYTKLEELLDSYHAYGLSAYNKYYSEINTYRNKQNENAAKEQEKADKEALKAQEEADKAALKKLTSSQKDSITEIKKSLAELAKTYQSQYDDILKQQETYAKKLKSGLDIFQKEETDDKIIYSISNIKEYKKQVDDLTNTIQKLKDRGLNSDLLSEIMDMDMSEGLIYGENLLAMSDSEFNDINDTYNDLAALIDKRSHELYSDELQTVNDNFVSDVKSLFGTLPSEIQNIGLETAAGFVQGLDLSKATVISDTSDYFEDIFDSITDNIDSASAAVDTVDEYVDAFKTELDTRSSEIYDAISKLFADTDAAAVIKTAVENEGSAVSASVSSKTKSDSSINVSDSGSKGIESLIDALNKPIYITLDGQTIAEYVISYTNNKSRATGVNVIK